MLLCNRAARSCRVLDVRDSIKPNLFDSKLSILENSCSLITCSPPLCRDSKTCRVLYPGAHSQDSGVPVQVVAPFFSFEIFEQDGL